MAAETRPTGPRNAPPPIRVAPLSAALGARVEGLDPALFDGDGPDAVTQETLRQAFDDHQVLFFPELDPTPAQHLGLARVFGEPEVHVEGRAVDRADARYVDDDRFILVIDSGRNAANYWHTDATFRERPPAASVLAMRAAATSGGDTLWLDGYRAYEELAPPLQQLARSLRAIHGHPGASETNVHPVVRTHPRTGRDALWINRGWTSGLADVPVRQAQPLLRALFEAMEQPEYTCRWSWSTGDVAIWDNRCTLHYALRDFGDEFREVHRITLAGDVPGLAE